MNAISCNQLTAKPLSSDLRRRQLANLLTITESMIGHACNAEWEDIAKLEVNRKVELDQCFSIPVSDQDPPVIIEAIATLLHLNDKLVEAVAIARQQAAEEVTQINHNQQAIKQYLDSEVAG